MAQKDVLKSALMEHGALSVMTTGIILMLKLCVTSWALHKQVHHYQALHKLEYHLKWTNSLCAFVYLYMYPL